MTTLSSTRIEGGLFSPDLFQELTTGGVEGQRPTDFGLAQGRLLNDEMAATFQDARALWGVFQHRLAKLGDADLATGVTRDGWVIPFLGLLGYELRFNSRAFEVDGQTYAISHRAGAPDAAPPIHIVGARQDLGRVPASGRPRMAPHSLVQEFLNRSEQVWGVVTNGRTLRLLRDTTFVRRQAYVEFDLEAMFEEQRFDDFAVFYRLLHRTRLSRGVDDVADCLLEQYYARSVEQGGRVREHLREGVELCLTQLANGFLSHPANAELTRALDGDALYRQLLRIVYRFLFLLVSEERGLVSREAAYREHYGVARLRRLVDSRGAYTDDDDLWQSLRVLWKVLASEELAGFLGVAPLNGQLFDPLDLDACSISNRDLLDAFWRLSWYREGTAQPRRVNYAALDVEELGSVYESLLEFHPRIEQVGGGRREFRLLAGSERKTTGSYYTPPELVNELIQSALEPVMQARLDAAGKTDRAAALLSIRVCDPACGSGHFLLAAARRLGKALARERTGEDEPAPERVRESTRDVIAHCIYGVDRNPLAVDLCRVALWLESHTGGRPLTFLDHRIKCGDSLVGVFDLATLASGIPDKAFAALEGDDKEVANTAAKQNKRERETGARSLFDVEDQTDTRVLADLGRYSRAVDALGEDSPEAVRRKRQRYELLQQRSDWVHQKKACDLWTAAFFQRLESGRLLITSGRLAEHLGGGSIDPRLHAEAMVRSHSERFFHWPLEFPEVMADGGFDVVLSNPPWEHVELKEQEFFAARDAQAASARTKAERARRIDELADENPTLHQEYRDALRSTNAARLFLATGERFPLTGRGRINTYAVFAELCRSLVRLRGITGVIVPTGIATDDTTKFYFQSITQSHSLVSLYDFENRRGIFPAVHKSYKFCLLTVANRSSAEHAPAEYVFFALEVAELRQPEKRFTLTADEIALLNPNTGNCPIFRTRADAELTKAIYRRVPVLWREATATRPEDNPWKLRFSQGLFNMSSDSHHFKLAPDLEREGYRREGNVFVSPYDRYLPLYEAKMIHQFDHRWATYDSADEVRDVTVDEKRNPNFVVQPRYWVREEIVESAIPKFPEPLADAVAAESTDAIRAVLHAWLAGYYEASGQADAAQRHHQAASGASAATIPKPLLRVLRDDALPTILQQDFALTKDDVSKIEAALPSPKNIADEFIQRFSPKWFLGWRDICRATDERTTIAAAIPKAAVGDTFLLMFSVLPPTARLPLLACLDSFVQDYAARQKVGGTHMKYNVFRQIPVPTPDFLASRPQGGVRTLDWLGERALRLSCTAADLDDLGLEGGLDGPSTWDAEERTSTRIELDAALFHVYLSATPDGQWLRASRPAGHVVDETPEELAALRAYFPTPRHAVEHILDQFPIVQAKDEYAHGSYVTKERLLRAYDALLAALRTGTPLDWTGVRHLSEVDR